MAAAVASKVEYCLVSEEQQEDKKSVNKREGDDVPDSVRGDLKKLKESDEKNNNKAHKSQYPFSFFYGSDDGQNTVYPDDDEEDTPKPRDAEEREAMWRACGPPVYVSNKKAIEELEKQRAFERTHGMLFPNKSWFEHAMLPTLPPPEPLPLPPPPSSLDFAQQLSSLNFVELVSLLEEELNKLHSSAPGVGRQTEVYS